MKRLYFFCFLFISISIMCFSENRKVHNQFNGVWVYSAGYGKIEEFLSIQRIDDHYLIIDSDTDDDCASKGIGKEISKNIIEVKLGELNYQLVYGKEGEDEWIEMYLTPHDEEYPVYERIENFSIDKFF